MIIYLLKNKINDKLYVGKTNNLYKRLSSHKNDRRHITPLTKAIDKHGFHNFECIILEKNISKENIREREQFYIEKFNTYKSNHYNCTAGGNGFLSGKEHPLYGKERPRRIKEKISKTKKINHPFRGSFPPWLNRGHLEGYSHPNAKEWIVISPEGEELKIRSLEQFCKQNNLTSQNMRSVAKGKRKHHKGWFCKEVVPNEQ